MNILFIGDICGKPGRKAVSSFLPSIMKDYNVDFVIANAENIAHGIGITSSTLDSVLNLGINCFTGGNHIFQKDGISIFESGNYPIIRPFNFPEGTVGDGYKIFDTPKGKILVANLMGNVFMPYSLNCPFKAADKIVNIAEENDVDFIIIDFHAEATSEKTALKHYLDGRVTALFGTHTHVPTRDLQITKEKMAYITDVGMTGIIKNSVLGVNKDLIIEKFKTQMHVSHEIEMEGSIEFNSILIETAEKKYAIKAEFLSKEIDE